MHAGNNADAKGIVTAKLLTGQKVDSHDWLNVVLDAGGAKTVDTFSFITVKDAREYIKNFTVAKDGAQLIEDLVISDLGGGMKVQR